MICICIVKKEASVKIDHFIFILKITLLYLIRYFLVNFMTEFFYLWRYGSITQASTVRLGIGSDGEDVYVGFNSLLPMVNPNDIVVDGWDISGLNIAEAVERARVLEPTLKDKLRPHLVDLKPRTSIYNPDFIAANQVIMIICNFPAWPLLL